MLRLEGEGRWATLYLHVPALGGTLVVGCLHAPHSWGSEDEEYEWCWERFLDHTLMSSLPVV
eukprot:10418328-Prorocentrum_lima.AAC.1